MTRNEILRRWPNATEATIRRNLSAGLAVPDPEPCQRTVELAGDSPGKAPRPVCPLVRFTLRRVKLLDVDAKFASVKDLLDGLAHAGIVAGDQEGQVRLEVEQEKVRSYQEERTIIELF
jgi:hypothetical protein